MKKLLVELKEVREELLMIQEKIKGINEVLLVPNISKFSDMPKSKNNENGIIEGLIFKEELEEKYNERLLYFLKNKQILENKFNESDLTLKEKRILEDYYFSNKTWNEVSNDLGLSLSWVFKIHKAALSKIH